MLMAKRYIRFRLYVVGSVKLMHTSSTLTVAIFQIHRHDSNCAFHYSVWYYAYDTEIHVVCGPFNEILAKTQKETSKKSREYARHEWNFLYVEDKSWLQ